MENNNLNIESKSLPYSVMAFHRWMVKEGWQEHSSRDYFYKSKDHSQWPPDQTATEEELLRMFFIQ